MVTASLYTVFHLHSTTDNNSGEGDGFSLHFVGCIPEERKRDVTSYHKLHRITHTPIASLAKPQAQERREGGGEGGAGLPSYSLVLEFPARERELGRDVISLVN